MMRVVVGSLLLLARLSFAADLAPEHVRNFGQVNEILYRGGEPTDEGLRELRQLGIKLVIDLREESKTRDIERQKVEQLGMRYAHLAMKPFGAPTEAQVEQALSLILHETSGKIFVHCLRGKDRTGTVIACYRVQHDGWDNERALQEAKAYGMSPLERAMQAFIKSFTPVTLANPGLFSN
jgi:protein tyrosine/serine phosphatase